MSYIATSKLYLTADRTRVVTVSSKDAGYVFRSAGGIVTQAEVDRYKIGSDLVRPSKEQAAPPTPTVVAEDVPTEPTTNEGEEVETQSSEATAKAETEAPNTKATTQSPKGGKKGK